MRTTSGPRIRDVIAVPRFRSHLIGSVALGIGYLLESVACSWEMLQLTDSALWVGLIAAAPMLPLPVLSPIAGVVADRLSRRLLMLLSTSIMASAVLTMATLVAVERQTPLLLFGLSLLVGVGIAFFDPSWLASIPDLVPRRLVAEAVAVNAAGSSMTWAVGSAIGGLLVAGVGVALTLAMSALGYLVMFTAALRPRHEGPPGTGTSLMVALLNGVNHVRFRPTLRSLLLTVALFCVSSIALQTLLPVISVEVLRGGSATYASVLAAFGAGSLLGLVTRRRGSAVLGTHMVPATIVGFGVTGTFIATVDGLVLMSALLIVAGMFWTWADASLSTAVQLLVPGWVRARVLSFYALTMLGSMSAGSILAGTVANASGATRALQLCALTTVVVGILAYRLAVPQPAAIAAVRPIAGWHADPPPVWAGNHRVLVVTTWTVDADSVRELRRLLQLNRSNHMMCGASRWSLYRHAGDPRRFSEVVIYSDWEQYQRMTEQLTVDAAAVIERSWQLDVTGEPLRELLVESKVDGPVPSGEPFDEMSWTSR